MAELKVHDIHGTVLTWGQDHLTAYTNPTALNVHEIVTAEGL